MRCEQTGVPVPRPKDGGWLYKLTQTGPHQWACGTQCEKEATHRLTSQPRWVADNGQVQVSHWCDEHYHASWADQPGTVYTSLIANHQLALL